MKKEILAYIDEVQLKAADGSDKNELRELADSMLVRIGFYQHERLIHLIVTMSFAVFFLLSLILAYLNTYFLALSALLLVLLVPYIAHYYYLENSVQKLYTVYYKVREKYLTTKK